MLLRGGAFRKQLDQEGFPPLSEIYTSVIESPVSLCLFHSMWDVQKMFIMEQRMSLPVTGSCISQSPKVYTVNFCCLCHLGYGN